jgi:hypothetical protein
MEGTWESAPEVKRFRDNAQESYEKWSRTGRLGDAISRDTARTILRIVIEGRGEPVPGRFPWEAQA